MAADFEFKVGETYANRRGQYNVLAVEPPNIRVRYEDGHEDTLNIEIQKRIMNNMTLPPRVPEPPPRTRTSSAKAAAAAPKTRQAAPAAPARTPRTRRTADAATSDDTPTATVTATGRPGRRPRVVHSDLTLQQLCALPREERRDKIAPLLTTRESFVELVERSVEADRGRYRLFTPDHVHDLQQTEVAPTRSEPELLLSYAVVQNREFLDERHRLVLARRYPLLEGGVERDLIDLLAYEGSRNTPIVIETRVKTTQRQWLWEALLEVLRKWIGFSRAANLNEALAAYPVESQPLVGVLAPTAFWNDNVAASLPKIGDFPMNAGLNTNMLIGMRQWIGMQPLLLQVPDTWIREADEAGRPSVLPVTGF